MNSVANILKNKCPKCKTGDIFKDNVCFHPFKVPRMNDRCPSCNYKFEKETGFFFGAMFVSYALAVAQMIIVLLVFWGIIGLSPIKIFLIIAVVAFLSSTLNFKLSRSIWIYLFFRKE